MAITPIAPSRSAEVAYVGVEQVPVVTWRFCKFLLAGGLCTALQYLILVVLVHSMSVDPTLGSSVGYMVSGVVNYLTNRRITFRSDAPHSRAAPRFVLVAGSGLLINGFIMWTGTKLFKIHYLPVQVVATVLVTLFNYTAHKSWSFAAEGGK